MMEMEPTYAAASAPAEKKTTRTVSSARAWVGVLGVGVVLQIGACVWMASCFYTNGLRVASLLISIFA